MQVRTQYGYIVDIFGYYHIGYHDYLVAFPREHGGLLVYSKNEVEIIDHVLYGRWVFYKNGIYHWTIIEEELLDDLFELDTDAYERFLNILKSEGLVEQDFR